MTNHLIAIWSWHIKQWKWKNWYNWLTNHLPKMSGDKLIHTPEIKSTTSVIRSITLNKNTWQGIFIVHDNCPQQHILILLEHIYLLKVTSLLSLRHTIMASYDNIMTLPWCMKKTSCTMAQNVWYYHWYVPQTKVLPCKQQ